MSDHVALTDGPETGNNAAVPSEPLGASAASLEQRVSRLEDAVAQEIGRHHRVVRRRSVRVHVREAAGLQEAQILVIVGIDPAVRHDALRQGTG